MPRGAGPRCVSAVPPLVFPMPQTRVEEVVGKTVAGAHRRVMRQRTGTAISWPTCRLAPESALSSWIW